MIFHHDLICLGFGLAGWWTWGRTWTATWAWWWFGITALNYFLFSNTIDFFQLNRFTSWVRNCFFQDVTNRFLLASPSILLLIACFSYFRSFRSLNSRCMWYSWCCWITSVLSQYERLIRRKQRRRSHRLVRFITSNHVGSISNNLIVFGFVRTIVFRIFRRFFDFLIDSSLHFNHSCLNRFSKFNYDFSFPIRQRQIFFFIWRIVGFIKHIGPILFRLWIFCIVWVLWLTFAFISHHVFSWLCAYVFLFSFIVFIFIITTAWRTTWRWLFRWLLFLCLPFFRIFWNWRYPFLFNLYSFY